MIRINRLIKKDSIFDILELPNICKVELLRRKANQKNPYIIRAYIYLRIENSGRERTVFNNLMNSINKTTNKIRTTIDQAISDGFIKESTYKELGISIDKRCEELCNKYNQEFFFNYESNKS